MAQRRREEIAKVEAELAKADGNLRVFYKKAEIMGKLMEGCPPDPAKLDAAARDMRSSYDKYLVSVMYSNFKLSKFLNYYGPVDQDFTHLHKRVNDLKISHGGLGPKKNQWRGIKIAVTMVNSGINRSADNYDTAVVVLREIDKWGNRAALATGIAGLAKGAIQIAAAEIAETTIKEGLKAAAAYAAKEVAKYGIRMGAAYAVSEGLMGMGVDRKYVNIGFTAYHMWTIGNMLRSVPNARAQPKPKGSTLNERINANGQANPGSLSARQAGTGNRLLRDARVNPQAPARKPLNRNVSRSSTQNARAQRDAARLRAAGAEDVRINQQQVNAAGERVGINRPDLHYTNKGQRVYIEYESPGSTRGPAHRERILANDSSGKVIIRKNAE
jgi:hypothetical protein